MRIALAGSTVAALGVANAQTAPSTAGAAIEEVVVTGSRIAVPNETAISPVLAVTPVEIAQSGATKVEDLLNSLPQVFASQNGNVSNGSDGTSTVDLRGLGTQRTLVLVNGRRLGLGDPNTGSQQDLNNIPLALVERVDVLTGGASSVYGADAVSGVVNFVMNNHFEGIKLVGQYGLYNHHNDNPQGVATDLAWWNENQGTNFPPAPNNVQNGYTKDLALLFGFNTPEGNGNVTTYITYRNVAGVLQSQFDYSACNLASGFLSTSSSALPGHFGCAGSSTSYPGRFRLVNQFGKNAPASAGGGSKTVDENGNLSAFGNGDRYNFGPLNYYQRPDERWTAGAFAHYEFNEHADVYTEIQFANDRTIAQIAPSGAFYGSGLPYKVNCANPLLSANQVATWCQDAGADPNTNFYLLIGRRNVEGGPRQDDLEHTGLRIVLGDKGKIDDAWSYDVSGVYALTQLAESYINDVSHSRIQNALTAVTDANGNIVCQSVVTGTDPNCVPWNIFRAGAATQQAIKYISIPLLTRGQMNMYDFIANFTGDLGKYGVQLPSAGSGLKMNAGVEWRETKVDVQPDLEYQINDASGQGAPRPAYGGLIVSREAFIEARLPLIDDKTGAKSLALDAGYRYSDYSPSFQTNTYKFGLEWAPVQDVRFRGSYARAVRAPNTYELFQPRLLGLDGSTDPCSGASPKYTLAQCQKMGVTAAQYGNIDPNPAAQYNGYIGGNPLLQPEVATTQSFGVGFTPSALPGFRAQVDYFDIKIEHAIQRIGPSTIMSLCANSDLYCGNVHRDINGSLWASDQGYVDDPLNNNGGLREKGVDLDLAYTLAMGSAGKLRAALVGTYLTKVTFTPLESIPSTSYDCEGYYGPSCSFNYGPNYKWRHTLRLTWQTPWHGSDVSLAWRYFDSVKLDALSSNPNLTAGPGCTVDNGCISNTDAKIPSVSYLDLTGSIQINDKINFRLGINNLLDKSPPVIGNSSQAGSGLNGNTYASVYDVLGRYVFGTLTVQF